MGLIYELTAATLDATEAGKWASTAGAAMVVDGDLVKITADPYDVHGEYGTLAREPIDPAGTPAGRYVLLVDVVESLDRQAGLPIAVNPASVDATFLLSIPGGHNGLVSTTTERYMAAFDVDPSPDDPVAPKFNQIITSIATAGLYLSRLAIYRVDGGPLLDQLAVQILTPGSAGFRLNVDELDDGQLGDTATATAWTDYLCDATGVTLNRGASVDGVTTTTQVGTANLTVYAGPDDPPGLGLRPNLPVRVRSRLTETVAYTGAVGDLADTWRRPTTAIDRRFMASIPCVDAVRDLAGITRYGALAIDTWGDRVARIMASYPGRWDYAPGTYATAMWPVMARTVYESTLDKHLQLVTNSSAGRWYVDRDNVVRVEQSNWTAQDRPVRLIFSDVHDDYDPRHRCYTDLTRTYDTRSLANDLTFANHDATLNDQGQWQAADTNLGPFQDVTSAATWGVRHADIETNLELGPGDPGNDIVPTPDPAGDLVAEYTRDNANPTVRFTSVTYNATKDVDIACLLDVFDSVIVVNNGLEQLSRIIGIQHTITPTKWLVTLALQAWSVG